MRGRLVGLLAAEYPGSEHVEGAGLLGADDLTVWQYAAGHGLIVVSKDSDFRHLALLQRFLTPFRFLWIHFKDARAWWFPLYNRPRTVLRAGSAEPRMGRDNES